MSEVERLTEAIKKGLSFKLPSHAVDNIALHLAEYLLDNGVIVPPCKAGDTVYEVIHRCNAIRPVNVVGFHLGKFPSLRGCKRKQYLICYSQYSLAHLDIDKIGKTVFLTKEEAEKALKGGVE